MSDNIIPKVELLDDVSEGHADIIILKYPLWIDYSVESVSEMVGYFKSDVGMSDSQVSKVLLKRPTIVSNGLEKMAGKSEQVAKQ